MATPVKKWLLRVAPWFLPVGIVAVWQLASSVGWLSTRILPSPEGVVTAFWTLSASGELWQHLAISSWRALIGFSIGGSSDVAQELAAEQVDLYLTWGEPPELVKEKIEQVRAKAAAHGRKIRFGIRLHVIVRETNDEAWQAAERLISHLDDETIAKAQAAFARTDSVGQQRMAALHNGKRDNLEISPNLWAGVGLVRGGAGTALVGDGPTVAARINEYAALGIDSFVLSGYPHLEEAYRVGELLFPHLDVAIPEIPQPQLLNPQGEAVANDFIPRKVAQS